MRCAVRLAPRPGVTLLEVIAVVTILSLLLGFAVPDARAGMARRSAAAAARELALLLSSARQIAATSTAGAAVGFDTAGMVAHLTVDGDTVRSLDLRANYGVRLRTTRDSVAYDSRGLGHGAANVTVILSQAAAAETLVVSRLGRLRGGW